jgi:hypothetical protein
MVGQMKYAVCNTTTGAITRIISCSQKTASIQVLEVDEIIVSVSPDVTDASHCYADGEVVPKD